MRTRRVPPRPEGTSEDGRSPPLEVLVFSPDPSMQGGVSEFCRSLAKYFSPGTHADWFFIGQRNSSSGRIFRLIFPLIDPLRLVLRVLRRRYDVYHLNPSMVPRAIIRDGVYLLLLSALRQRRVIVFFRGWDDQFFARIVRSRVCRWMFIRTYGRAARTLVLGSSIALDLRNLGFREDSVHLMTTMFDGAYLRDCAAKKNMARVQILFLARFVTEKGIYELLEAYRRLRLDTPGVSLVLAGDGPEFARLVELRRTDPVLKGVHMPGYLRGQAKAAALLESDIFVLPSYREGCPNALLEAMAAGLPTVVSAVGGIPDIVRPGLNGFLVPARDLLSLEEALRQLVADADLRKRMSARNREEAWSKYEASRVTARLEGHYLSVSAKQ